MMLFWGLVLGTPILAFGGVLAFSPSSARRFSAWFRSSRELGIVLETAAWIWTAIECDTIGIDAFDMVTKRFPGELWLLAAVLSYLTAVWMPKNLSVRALSGLLMLLPAELFKTTHAYRPDAGVLFAPVDLVVLTAYIGAVVGMYGMFYPWRLEKGFDLASATDARARALGAVLAVWGAAVAAVALSLQR